MVVCMVVSCRTSPLSHTHLESVFTCARGRFPVSDSLSLSFLSLTLLSLSHSPVFLLSSLLSPLGAENVVSVSGPARCKMAFIALYFSMAVSGVLVVYWLVLR